MRERSDDLPRAALTIASAPRRPTTSAAIAAPIGADSHAVARIRNARTTKTTPKIAVTIRLALNLDTGFRRMQGALCQSYVALKPGGQVRLSTEALDVFSSRLGCPVEQA